MMDSGLSTLLLDLYDCPRNAGRWPQVLDGIRERLRVRSAAVQILSTSTPRVTVRWVARDSESQANRGHHDPFIAGDENPRLRLAPPRSSFARVFMRDQDYFPAGGRELAQLHQRLADLGLGSCLSAGVCLSPQESLVLVLHRDLKDPGHFSDRDEALVMAVMPHMRQAISLSDQLQAARALNQDLQHTIDRFSFGLVLCDADARRAWANHAAERAFREQDVLWLTQGRLTGVSASQTQVLRRTIAEVAREATADRSR
jgi:hypothetical protein